LTASRYILIVLIQGERAVLGTDIARELHERNFQGLVLIRSANSSELDALEYMADGSVHATLGECEF
jgi:hypothetical protein